MKIFKPTVRKKKRILNTGLCLVIASLLITGPFLHLRASAETTDQSESAEDASTSPAGQKGQASVSEEIISMSADGAAAIFRADNAVLLQSPDVSVISASAETPVTRAEAIAAIGQLFHADTNMTAASAQWTDVSADQDLTPYINWGSSLHLIYPRTDTEFAPNDTISREDFIMILYRALNSAGLELQTDGQAVTWSDSRMISDYADEAVDTLSAAGIIETGEDDMLRPEEPITQASAYQILLKTYRSLYEDLQEEVVFDDTASIPEMTKLKEELEQELGRQSNNWAVYVKCLDTGQEIAVNDSHMCSASLIKLFVAGTYLRAIEDGTVEDTSSNSGYLTSMISRSSNTAWIGLETALGHGNQDKGIDLVNAFIQSEGYKQTERKLAVSKAVSSVGYSNFSTVSEVGDVLDRVYHRTYVSADASERLENLMLDQEHRQKIPSGLPYGTVCANKTGELSDIQNDSAIVWSDGCDYVLIVMSEGNRSEGSAVREISNISSIVYDYFNPEDTSGDW